MTLDVPASLEDNDMLASDFRIAFLVNQFENTAASKLDLPNLPCPTINSVNPPVIGGSRHSRCMGNTVLKNMPRWTAVGTKFRTSESHQKQKHVPMFGKQLWGCEKLSIILMFRKKTSTIHIKWKSMKIPCFFLYGFYSLDNRKPWWLFWPSKRSPAFEPRLRPSPWVRQSRWPRARPSCFGTAHAPAKWRDP